MSTPTFRKPEFINTSDLPRADIETVEGVDYGEQCLKYILEHHVDAEVPNRIYGIDLRALGGRAYEDKLHRALIAEGYKFSPSEWGGRKAVYTGYLVSMTSDKIATLSQRESD